jgi:hypothetical protein
LTGRAGYLCHCSGVSPGADRLNSVYAVDGILKSQGCMMLSVEILAIGFTVAGVKIIKMEMTRQTTDEIDVSMLLKTP